MAIRHMIPKEAVTKDVLRAMDNNENPKDFVNRMIKIGYCDKDKKKVVVIEAGSTYTFNHYAERLRVVSARFAPKILE